VLAIGATYLPIAIVMFFGSAVRAPMNGLINGSGNYRVNFVTAILDGIVIRIGLSLLFGLALRMGAHGFWLGDAIAGYTPFFIGLFFYRSGVWKKGMQTESAPASL
jgi:Na+-driven multidrug efflux pump